MSQIFQYFSIFTVLFYKTDIRLNYIDAYK